MKTIGNESEVFLNVLSTFFFQEMRLIVNLDIHGCDVAGPQVLVMAVAKGLAQ